MCIGRRPPPPVWPRIGPCRADPERGDDADPVRVGAPAQTHDSSSWRPRRSATLYRPLVRRSNGSPAFLGGIRFRARDDAGQVSWPPTAEIVANSEQVYWPPVARISGP